MDEIKKISSDEIKAVAAERGYDIDLMFKDYYVTLVIYLLKDIEGIYFKGGTALQKILLNYSRLSKDADYTVVSNLEQAKKEIKRILKKSGVFSSITKDKDVDGFTRIVAHYKNFSNQDDAIFVDINQRAKLLLKPEKHEIKHFYPGFIPPFQVPTLAKQEMIAEKVAATMGRNRPRDHYDAYQIIQNKIPINLKLVEKKCEQSGNEFDIIHMFNKANKLKTRWDKDMLPLLSEEVPFVKVMKTLSRYFKLKEAKEKQRNDK